MRSCIYCNCKQNECHFVEWRSTWGTAPSDLKTPYVCTCHFPVNAYTISGGKVTSSTPNLLAPIAKLPKDSVIIKRKEYDELLRIKSNYNGMMAKMKTVFTGDQIKLLQNTQVTIFSDETIQKRLAIKLYCGNNGYEYLRKLLYPSPALRTIQSRSTAFEMPPGYLYEVRIAAQISHFKT